MISDKSLVSPMRRIIELRRMQNKMRSLKRSRYVIKLTSIQIGDKLAIIHLIDDTISYLKCTFSVHLEGIYNTEKKVQKMIDILEVIKIEILKASKNRKGVPKSIIRQFGSATVKLYRATRKKEINLDCSELWRKIGLCANILF